MAASVWKGHLIFDIVSFPIRLFSAARNEWIFYTDRHTFADRYELIKDRGLQGFCSWVLGAEDPEIWKYLPQSR